MNVHKPANSRDNSTNKVAQLFTKWTFDELLLVPVAMKACED